MDTLLLPVHPNVLFRKVLFSVFDPHTQDTSFSGFYSFSRLFAFVSFDDALGMRELWLTASAISSRKQK